MKWNIDDLPVFLAVKEKNGISAAARHLGMPKSSVSRTLSRLEENLEIRLFDRNTRDWRLTGEGEAFSQHALSILEQVALADDALLGMRSAPSGTLKVALPMAFSKEIIGGKLASFSGRYPDITLQITVAGHAVNLLTEDLDLAFMVGPIMDSEMISQKISDSNLIWVASSDYVATNPVGDHLADLKQHVTFCETRYQMTRLPVRSPTGRHFLDTSSLMSVNDAVILRDIVRQGGGVALLSELYCQKDLQSGRLVQLCASIIPEPRATIYAVRASRRLQMQKTKVFIDFVKDCVANYAKTNRASP